MAGTENPNYFDPSATVTALVLKSATPDPEILLTLREIEPFRDCWCLPGGHIDKFEASYDAIVREVREETGLRFKGLYFGAFDEIFPALDIHNVVTAFAGTGAGELIRDPVEVREMEWVTLSAARQGDLAFAHNSVLDAFAGWYRPELL